MGVSSQLEKPDDYWYETRLCPRGCGVRLNSETDSFGLGSCPKCGQWRAVTVKTAWRRGIVRCGGWLGAFVVWAWDSLKGRPGHKGRSADPWEALRYLLMGRRRRAAAYRIERHWWGTRAIPLWDFEEKFAWLPTGERSVYRNGKWITVEDGK